MKEHFNYRFSGRPGRKLAALLLAALMLGTSGCSSEKNNTAQETAGGAEKETTAAVQADTAEQEYTGYISPVFSVEGGFIAEPSELTISLPANAPKGSFITFTTDGSEPGIKSKRYSSPIRIGAADATIVRAVCFDGEGKQISHIETSSYIKAAPDRFNTLVVSLVTDDKNLYGGTGIIDHPRNSGKDWERPCHVEIFEQNGTRVISQDAGIRIFGGSSRVLPQKSFRLIARKDGYYDELKYNGKGSFEYPFFEGRTILAGENAGQPVLKYDRLVLRNGGNDSIQATAADPTAMTLTRDAVANAFIAANSDKVAYQSSRFAAVYLNGEYYGILDLKEDINDNYMRNLYGVEEDNVTVIKSELDTSRHCEIHDNGGSCRFDDVWFFYEVDDGDESELTEYENTCREAIAALGGSEEELAAAYDKLGEKVDLDSFLEYTALCLYMCNTDWPHNNLRVWRYTGPAVEGNPYTDGKWRYTARDLDFCFGRYECLVLPEIYTMADMDNISFTLGNYKHGGYEYDGNYPDSLYLQGMLALCLHNDGFRERFISYCEKLCSDEAKESLKAIMDGYAAQIENEIPYHIDCWDGTISGDYTADIWKKNTEDMKEWADERPDYFRQYLGFITEYMS